MAKKGKGIVRRYDKNGRKYYINKATGKRTGPEKWVDFQLEKKQKKAEAAERGKTKKDFSIKATVSHRNFLDTVQTLVIEKGYKAEIIDTNGNRNKFSPKNSLGFGLLMKKIWKDFERLLKEIKDKTSPDILIPYEDFIKIKTIKADLRHALYNY